MALPIFNIFIMDQYEIYYFVGNDSYFYILSLKSKYFQRKNRG